MRYVLSCLALLSSLTHAEIPTGVVKSRAAYLCEALITNASPERPLRHADLYPERFAELLRRAVNQLSRERFEAFGLTVRRMNPDIRRIAPNRFAVRQELVGADAIRGYLKRVTKDSEQLEATHVPERARQPFETRPRLLKDLTATLVSVGMGGIWGYLTADFMHHGHPLWAMLPGFMVYRSLTRLIVPYLIDVACDIRNMVVLRGYRRTGEMPAGWTSAEILDQSFGAFAADIKKTLAGPMSAATPPVWASARIPLPLSRSTTSYWLNQREVLKAAEIKAAVRRSGDFRLPADPRVMDIDHVFFYDTELKQPVLLTLVRERTAR